MKLKRIFLVFLYLFLCAGMVSCQRWRKTADHGKKHPKKGSEETSLNMAIVNRTSIVDHRSKRELACRASNGCLHVCQYFDEPGCQQLSVNGVIKFWLKRIDSNDDWNKTRQDLQLIATNTDVALFLNEIDEYHHVLQALFMKESSLTECPMSSHIGIHSASNSPFTSLFVVHLKSDDIVDEEIPDTNANEMLLDNNINDSSSDTGEVSSIPHSNIQFPDNNNKDTATAQSVPVSEDEVVEEKQIMVGANESLDSLLYSAFVKKCFGENHGLTFTALAVENDNKSAFDIAHHVLLGACSGNRNCVRLAYCEIDSAKTWEFVDDWYKKPGCKYESFVINKKSSTEEPVN